MSKENKKQILIIFTFLAIFILSLGIWENYKMLWLEENAILVKNIGYIISAASFITCLIAIFLISVFKKINVKLIIQISAFLKLSCMFVLCFLFKSNSENLIIILFILDAVFGNLIVLSIYPLLTKIVKNEKMYSKKSCLNTQLKIWVY